MPEAADQLFAVRVTGPGRVRWRVLVRAPDGPAAAARIASRGHDVLEVAPAADPSLERLQGRKPPTICLNCRYSLRGLEAGEAKEITCPECGVTNLPLDLPDMIDQMSRRGSVRIVRRAAWAFASLVIMVLIIVLARVL